MDNREKILKKYCGSLSQRIDACKDRKVVELLKERICSEIKQFGGQEISLADVESYLDELISAKFMNKE